MQQVGFAEPDIAMEKERIEQRLRARERAGHLLRRGMGKPVRGPDEEARKTQARIKRGTFEAAISGT